MGEVGLLPDQLWAMSWNDYERAVRGYELRQVREWERTRKLGEWMAAFNGVDLAKELAKVGKKRLIDLPTDPVAKQVHHAETPEEFMARMRANNFFLNGNPGRA